MMPEMDGIETTKKLHTLGYTGTIVALTANALVGNDEMFMQNGFDGFLPKPIDARRLNDVLNKFIRDKYPEEAKKYKSEIEAAEYMRTIDSNLFRVFRRDAEKTVVTLRETAANGDLKLFATTAHAMKSALANIGEHEVSKAASTLEEAGLKNDSKFIAANTESFIKTLETLINKLNPDIISDEDDTKIAEDVVYLREQIEIVITACEEYDNNTAYAALDRLKENIWKSKTSASIENIRDVLFSSSDFDVAIEICKSLLNEE
jgi:HPt (histidine-containing phosphotransfer) domain-containing protein